MLLTSVLGSEPWVLQQLLPYLLRSVSRETFSQRPTRSVSSYVWDADHCLKVLPSDELVASPFKTEPTASEFLAWESRGITQKCKFSETRCKKGL